MPQGTVDAIPREDFWNPRHNKGRKDPGEDPWQDWCYDTRDAAFAKAPALPGRPSTLRIHRPCVQSSWPTIKYLCEHVGQRMGAQNVFWLGCAASLVPGYQIPGTAIRIDKEGGGGRGSPLCLGCGNTSRPCSNSFGIG